MFFVTSLVINLFVLSYGDRKRQYEEMSILGVKKTTLLKSVLVESGLIYVIGVLVGFVIAIPCIKIALEMVKEALVFETVMAIPYGLFLGIVGICFVIILVFTYLIGVSSVNMESTNRTNKE